MSTINGSDVTKVVVACEAGMGSSAMLSSKLSSSLRLYGVTVEQAPVGRIPDDADLVLCHSSLAARARTATPETVVVEFRMFLGDPVLVQVEQAIKDGRDIAG